MRESFKKIRTVSGAGEVDVILLFQHKEDEDFAYQVPVTVEDENDFPIYGGYGSEQKALDAGIEHLAEIEGVSVEEYKARMPKPRKARS